MPTWLSKFFDWLKPYLLDTVLLSIARLGPIVALVIGIHDLIANFNPFGWLNGVDPWFYHSEVLKDNILDVTPWQNIVLFMALWVGLMSIIQAIAESHLDKERHAANEALHQTLPITIQELKNTQAQLKTTQAEIVELKDDTRTQKRLGENYAGELTRTQSQLVATTNQLANVKSELASVRQELKQVKTSQAQAESTAATSQATAYNEVLGEIDPILNILQEYRSQVEAKYKNALNHSQSETSANLVPAVELPALPAGTTGTGPKTNYLK